MLHEMCDYVCHGQPPECQGSGVGGFRSGQVIYLLLLVIDHWSLIILRVDRPGFFSVPAIKMKNEK